ncbi:GAF domain-containing protein [Caldicoprobacter guelmensis]|uniref:GAF domain-containing protein n=1 Tax=Caldicoprobacter guelmensis TaxID=1170224 RepID=UPI001956BA8B
MHKIEASDKQDFYKQLNAYLEGMLKEEGYWLSALSNAAALLYNLLPDINWAGFYLYRGGELVLGPFQGKPACTRIALGKGVCGTAAATRQIQLVEDVNLYPGHIVCDPASQSEIVVPIIKDDHLIGVLDIDSPYKARFDEQDAEGLQSFVTALNQYVDWPCEF